MLLLRLRWLWDIVKRVRYKPVDYTVDELEQLKRAYAIDGFYIYDDVFILNKKFASAVSDEIIRRKLNLVWGCQSTVHVIDREIAALAARAGCVQIRVEAGPGRQSFSSPTSLRSARPAPSPPAPRARSRPSRG